MKPFILERNSIEGIKYGDVFVTVVFRYTHTQIIMWKSYHPNIIDVINHFISFISLNTSKSTY